MARHQEPHPRNPVVALPLETTIFPVVALSHIPALVSLEKHSFFGHGLAIFDLLFTHLYAGIIATYENQGSFVVILDTAGKEQRIIRGRDSGGIGAITISPDRTLLAVAERCAYEDPSSMAALENGGMTRISPNNNNNGTNP